MADNENWDNLREKIIGFGENSARKSYYPELQIKLADLQRFRALLDKTADGIFQINADSGSIIEVNEAAAIMLKTPVGSLKGKPFFSFFKPDVYNLIVNTFISEDEIIPTEICFRTSINYSEFETLHLELSVKFVSLDATNYYVIIARDINEQKKTEITLQKLSKGVEQSSAIVMITDKNATIEYVNPKFEQITGYTLEESVGKNAGFIKSGNTPIDVYVDLWNTIKKGKEWSGELQNMKKNGDLYWELVHISPILDEKRNIINFVGIKDDITEKKNMIIELINAKVKAEEMSRLKSNFLANMSHELRTPMIGILGYSEIMQERAESEELKMMAQTIYKSGTRLIETLNLILDLSRIEAGKLELTNEDVNVSKLIKECISIHEKNALKKNLFIKYSSNEPDIITKGDARVFRDIINNLVNNAVKFTFSGGIEISSFINTQKDKLLITIKDSGIGIPAELQGVIFEEFRQVSEGRSRAFEGTGLGLSVTKKFIEKMGGTISVESEPGFGTAFHLSFPYSDYIEVPAVETIAIPQTEKKEMPISNQSIRILLVENDVTNQMVIGEYLKKGYLLDVVDRGEDAINAAEQNTYDIFLMDINLGRGLNGVEVTKRLRNMEKYKDTPIIAITAYTMKGDKEEFLEQGCSAYLAKPFNKIDLIDVINEQLILKQKR